MVLVKMETDLQNTINFGQFLKNYTKKIIQSCNGYLNDLHILCDPLVFARSVIKNVLELLSREIDVARKKKEGDD
jgi:hypothetical protein